MTAGIKETRVRERNVMTEVNTDVGHLDLRVPCSGRGPYQIRISGLIRVFLVDE